MAAPACLPSQQAATAWITFTAHYRNQNGVAVCRTSNRACCPQPLHIREGAQTLVQNGMPAVILAWLDKLPWDDVFGLLNVRAAQLRARVCHTLPWTWGFSSALAEQQPARPNIAA